MDTRLIISVKEARKLLGAGGNLLKDDQIELLIMTLTDYSSMMLNKQKVPEIQQGGVEL